jgi:hypothetical protein
MNITNFIRTTREQGQVNSIPIFIKVGVFQGYEKALHQSYSTNKQKGKYNMVRNSMLNN